MAQIKKDTSLRKAILQAAITGQLISTVEGSTETGKELLEKIKNEREFLVSNGIIKKETLGKSELNLSSMNFEIPENWIFVELQQIFRFVDYRGMTPNKNGTDVFLITASNIRSGFMDYTRKEYISRTEYETRKGRGITKKGDLLFTTEAPMGNAAICDLDECSCGQRIITFQNFNTTFINLKLYMYFINSPVFQQQLLDNCTGTTAQGIKSEKLQRLLLPLPPLSVQNAIVAKLEQVLPLVDAYENAILQKEELKSALPDKLKKAILQEAITGQLTEAWRKSATIKESGKQLLDRIIEERNAKALVEWEEALKKNPKAKKPVTVVASEIDEEDIPFEVPESWCWCRLGDLVPFGQCENAEPNEIEDEAWILDLEDIEKDSGRILQFKTKKEVDSKSTKHIFKKDYVLYSKLRPYLNKCVIAPKDGYCTSEILPLDFGKFINNRYVQTFLMSPYFVDYTDSLSFGVKMPRLGTEDGKKALVPLPPLEEQEEIVKKVEELLPLCK